MAKLYVNVALLILGIVVAVQGHARLMNPVGRSSIWRVPAFAALNPPVNENDAGIGCGNNQQEDDPGTNCGVCGDNPADPAPRENELGGKYDRGIITGQYVAGQVIDIEAEVTVNHQGTLEMRLCDDPTNATQNCFNQHVLQLTDGTGSKIPVTRLGTYTTKISLPAGVTCRRCVIQFNYRGADGSSGTTGPQRTYRGCSDISIS